MKDEEKTAKSDWFAEYAGERNDARKEAVNTPETAPQRGYERWERSEVGDDPARDAPQYREERRPQPREFENVREAPDLDPQDSK